MSQRPNLAQLASSGCPFRHLQIASYVVHLLRQLWLVLYTWVKPNWASSCFVSLAQPVCGRNSVPYCGTSTINLRWLYTCPSMPAWCSAGPISAARCASWTHQPASGQDGTAGRQIRALPFSRAEDRTDGPVHIGLRPVFHSKKYIPDTCVWTRQLPAVGSNGRASVQANLFGFGGKTSKVSPTTCTADVGRCWCSCSSRKLWTCQDDSPPLQVAPY